MKRTIVLAIACLLCMGMSAQTKTAYVDVYVRGGGQNMRVSLLFDGKIIALYERSDIGTVLGKFGGDGWQLDETINIIRKGFPDATRHKIHLIMKKEYSDGDPYAGINRLYPNEVGKKSKLFPKLRHPDGYFE